MSLPKKILIVSFAVVSFLTLLLRQANSPSNDDRADIKMQKATITSRDHFYPNFARLKCADTCRKKDYKKYILPSFVIAGTMKGGTSALREFLNQHPSVADNQHKEIHMLDKLDELKITSSQEDLHLDRCSVSKAYHKIFHKMQRKLKGLGLRKTNKGKVYFDKTPKYLAENPLLPQRLLCALPDTKVVVMLRNPVDRAYSQYQHRSRKESQDRSFEDEVQHNIDSITQAGLGNTSLTPQEEYDNWANLGGRFGLIQRGMYAVQLKQWIAVFRAHFGDPGWKQRLLIIESEAMKQDSQTYYNRILDFLGLPPHTLPPQQPSVHQYVDQYEPMRNDTRAKLEQWFRPHNQKLQQLLEHESLGIDISWAKS